jgi:hypothetical protein
MKQCWVLLPMLAILSGCAANVTHQVEAKGSDGIRYYLNAPYLIVYSDGKGGLQWQIRYMPDQTHVMSATPHVVGAHLEVNMQFQNGVLSNSTTQGDSTAIPRSIIAAVQNVAPMLLKALMAGPGDRGFPAPSVYKIVVSGDDVKFIGGAGDVSIQVPINYGPLPAEVPTK